jgi:hypothetical protein
MRTMHVFRHDHTGIKSHSAIHLYGPESLASTLWHQQVALGHGIVGYCSILVIVYKYKFLALHL